LPPGTAISDGLTTSKPITITLRIIRIVVAWVANGVFPLYRLRPIADRASHYISKMLSIDRKKTLKKYTEDYTER
jgi:hypothetical protein